MSNISKRTGIQPAVREEFALRDMAMAGDMVFSVSPSTVVKAPTAAVWTRSVDIYLKNAAGKVHDWFDKAIATGVSVGDTSSAGTATIPSTTLTFEDGKATVVVSGDAQAWLGGTAQVRTITSTKGTGIRQVRTITCTAGESTGAGDITMTVTAAGMSNSPKDVVVAIGASDDSVTQVGDLVRAALALDADVSSYFTVGGAAGAVVLTVIDPVADDATLDNTFVDTDTTGVTFGASVDTTPGTAPAAGDVTMTVTAAGMDNSPKDVVVAIGATDYDIADVGALVRAALELDADVGAFFDVSGTGGIVILTAVTPAADDGTLDNTFVDTDTTGVTFGASVDTTPGVAKETDTLTIAEATILGYTISAKTSVQTFSD
jgi:hypothetical protein